MLLAELTKGTENGKHATQLQPDCIVLLILLCFVCFLMVSRGDITKYPAWIVKLENSQIFIFRKALGLRGKWFLCVCVCVCVCV